MTRRAKIFLIAVPAAAAVIAAALFLFLKPRNASAAAEGGIPEIVAVETVKNQESIEISGNIEPANSADLAFPIAGYIENIFVTEGDSVDAGEVVATLEDSQQRYDLAEVQVEIDTEIVTGTKRNLDLLNLKLEMIQEELDNTRLSSTISGLVSVVDADVGDYVRAQEAGSDTDVVVRVIDRSTMKATVEVDELDAPYLTVGQKVEFIFDAYPDLIVPGRVSFVPLEAEETDQGIAVLQTEVTIDNPPDVILPYFTFSGEIFLSDAEDILLIPEEAVQTFGDETMVLKLVSTEEAEAFAAQRPSEGIPAGGSEQSADGEAGGMAAGTPPGPGGPGGEPPEGGGLEDIPGLPDGMRPVPTPVTIADYGSGMVQVLSGLEDGDSVIVFRTAKAADTASQAADGTEEEEGGTSVMELLGFGGGPGGGGPGGGPPGGGGPPPGGR